MQLETVGGWEQGSDMICFKQTTQAAVFRMDCGGQGTIVEPGRPGGWFLQSPQEGLIGVQYTWAGF